MCWEAIMLSLPPAANGAGSVSCLSGASAPHQPAPPQWGLRQHTELSFC